MNPVRARIVGLFVGLVVVVPLAWWLASSDRGSTIGTPEGSADRDEGELAPPRRHAPSTDVSAGRVARPGESERDASRVGERRGDGQGSLRVLALDDRGRPVPGAMIEVFEVRGALRISDPHAFGGEAIETGAADHDGRYETKVTGAAFFVHATDVEAGSSGYVTCHAAAAGPSLLFLRRPCLVRGTVLDRRGLPVPGAEVVPRRDSYVTGRRRGEGIAAFPQSVRTDRDGRFEMRFGGDGGFALRARDGDRESAEVAIGSQRPGTEMDVILQMPGRFAVKGHVQDPSSLPLNDVEVKLWGRDLHGYLARNDRILKTDTTSVGGFFYFDVPAAGKYTLAASGRGARSGPREVVVGEGRPKVDVELELALPGSIPVTVSRGGEPMDNLLVRAIPDAPETGSSYIPGPKDLWGGASGFTDEDGHVVLRGLHPETSYRLTVIEKREAALWFERRDVLADGRPYRFEIRPDECLTATLTGVVSGEAAGSPVIEGTVTLSVLVEGKSRTVDRVRLTRGDATFRFAGLRRGPRYVVSVSVRGFAWLTEVLEPLEEDRHLELAIPRFGTVTGKLMDAAGNAAPYRTIALVLDATPSRWFRRLLTADAEGRIHSEEISPGRYRIHPHRNAEPIGTVEIGAGEVEKLDLRLPDP